MTEEKLTQEIIDLANKWYEGDINEDEFKKQAKNLVKIDRYEQLMLGGVSSSYVYIITFYDYDHDVIKHTFTNEQTAINKHKELQENRTWGYYNLYKKIIE